MDNKLNDKKESWALFLVDKTFVISMSEHKSELTPMTCGQGSILGLPLDYMLPFRSYITTMMLTTAMQMTIKFT